MKLHNRENRYYDVYYKVTGSGKGDNARSAAYIILAEPGENILLRDAGTHHAGKNATASVGAVTFFDGLGTEIGDYDLEKKIREQTETVQRTEKRLSGLEKKRQLIEKEMEDVIKEMEAQNAELDKNKTILTRYIEQKELKQKKKN